MAAAAEHYADQIMVTSDNPRSEDPEQIIKDIMTGFNKPQSVWMETDRAKAIAQVLSNAQAQDCVLIAGKGHEDYQDIKGEKIPFSDKACVKQFYSSGNNNGANA
jgi:UDP-N-acetylmuramoyl-L-alanyl-D-glutamate--2,6-diaminopimelate ligase